MIPRLHDDSWSFGARSGDVEEALFVEKYLFLTTHMLRLIRETPLAPEAGSDRYLVLCADKAPEHYAQCVFIGAQAACCEVPAPSRLREGEGRACLGALARLGYDLVAAGGTYARNVAVSPDAVFDLSAFLLRTLYGAFPIDAATRIRFEAPLVTASRPLWRAEQGGERPAKT